MPTMPAEDDVVRLVDLEDDLRWEVCSFLV